MNIHNSFEEFFWLKFNLNRETVTKEIQSINLENIDTHKFITWNSFWNIFYLDHNAIKIANDKTLNRTTRMLGKSSANLSWHFKEQKKKEVIENSHIKSVEKH